MSERQTILAGPNGHKTKEVAELFNIAEPTVRAWSNEFADYLSLDANPGEKRTRYYNQGDVRVLALVTEMKAQGKTVEDIHASLKAGVRGDVDSAIEASQQRPQSLEQAMMFIQQLAGRVDTLETENTELQSQLTEWRDKANRLQGQIDADAKREKLTHEDVIALQREIAVLEYKLEQATKGGDA
ncbi:MAG: hypothetical protein CL607_23715 [Anaerolineaceae bacterium]|nr:hypothetical protein [Anaerolineaceae bacterium]